MERVVAVITDWNMRQRVAALLASLVILVGAAFVLTPFSKDRLGGSIVNRQTFTDHCGPPILSALTSPCDDAARQLLGRGAVIMLLGGLAGAAGVLLLKDPAPRL